MERKLLSLARAIDPERPDKAKCVEWVRLYENEFVGALAKEASLPAGVSIFSMQLGHVYGSILRSYMQSDLPLAGPFYRPEGA